MDEIITLVIDGDGNITTETQGFTGQACEKTVGRLLQSIGGQVIEDKKKPEYYEDGDDPVKVLMKG